MFASCENYLDVNDTPNSPLYKNIEPNLSLSAALSQSYRLISGDNRNVERSSVGGESLNQLGNLMLNSWAGNVNSFTGVFPNEYGSIMTASFYDNLWDYGYTNIANFQKIIDFPSSDFDNHKAIAKIMKSFYMQSIVDLYGDCPYTDAFQGGNLTTPTYEDDLLIYRKLYIELDEAISLINNSNSNDKVVGSEDCVMSGTMSRWEQFANTIKLRLIIRQSLSTNPDVIAYVNTKASLLGALPATNFLQADVIINPGYNKSNNDKQNPFYGRYGYNIAGAETIQRSLITPSKHVASVLNGTNDTRRSRLFTVTSNNVVGIEQGALSGGTTPTNPGRLGPAIIPVPVASDPAVGSALNGFIMTLSEVNFLISEASLRFPAFSGFNAKSYFDNAVIASFVRLSVGTTSALSTTAANTYLGSVLNTEGFGWNSTNKYKAIMTQKWIALMSVNAGESWFDYVRTGFPITPNALGNTFGKPKRLLYPTSETVTNSANVPKQTASSAFATGPFWAN